MTGGRKTRGGAAVFGGLGLVLFGAGACFFASRAVTVLTWVPATAVVLESRAVATGAGKYDAHILARFEAGGRRVETELAHDYRRTNRGWVAAAAERHAPGTEVSILYAPGDPRSARLGAGWNLTTFGTSLALFGIGALFAGIGWLGLRDVDLAEEEVGTTEHGRAPAAERTRTMVTGGFVVSIGAALVLAAAGHARSASSVLVPAVLTAVGLAMTGAGVLAIRLARR